MDYFGKIDDVQNFIGQQQDDKKWIRSGQIIDTGAKVYGYRVDNVHNETYRMWNGMQRNALTGDQEIEVIQEEEDEGSAGVPVDEDGNPIEGA